MKEIFAQRLKAARAKAGLSQQALAEQLGITKQAVSKYENGQMLPDSPILIRLSEIFNLKPDYFFRPLTVSLEQVEFRKRSSLRGKKLAALKADVADRLERYLELEELMNIQTGFENPIAGKLISSGEEVEEAAIELLDYWELGFNPLPNIFEMLEGKGIKLIEVEADPDFDGLSTTVQGNVPVIVVNRHFDNVRKRFTALHELGRLVLSFAPGLTEKQKERLCHRFAGSMMMPRSVLLHELGEKRGRLSINELIEIKEYSGISVQAIVYRAFELGVISKSTFRRFFEFVNAEPDRKLEKGWGVYEGKEHSGRFEQLLYKGVAEELISIAKAAALANVSISEFRDNLRMVV